MSSLPLQAAATISPPQQPRRHHGHLKVGVSRHIRPNSIGHHKAAHIRQILTFSLSLLTISLSILLSTTIMDPSALLCLLLLQLTIITKTHISGKPAWLSRTTLLLLLNMHSHPISLTPRQSQHPPSASFSSYEHRLLVAEEDPDSVQWATHHLQ